MAKLFVMVILIGLIVLPASAQDDITVAMLEEVIGAGVMELRNAVISPDASMLAWSAGDGLCIYTFEGEATDCTAYPELYRGQNPMVWSPGSDYLAFTENFFVQLNEPDVWLFDVEARIFFNRTDDGQFGGILRPLEGDRPRYIDTLPTWNPVTGDLYFFRSEEMELFGDNIRTTQLMRIAAGDVPVWAVAPEEAANLTIQFELPFSIYNLSTYTLNGALAFSPDGSQLAMLVRPNDQQSPDWGLWMFDVNDYDLDRLATMQELNVGLPEDLDRPLFPDGVAWSGENLVVSLINPSFDGSPVTSQLVYIDTAAEDVTPIMDFSGLEAAEFFNIDPASGVAPIFDVPRASVLAPDGKTLLYLNTTPDGVGGISAVALPPVVDAPARWWETEPVPSLPYFAPSAGTDGNTVRIVTAGYLVTYEE